ncbi:hypothetical protein [Isoptericola sp. NPDC058082]|uniref:hypothetical protein n=1 Tax=Isoptericola sp. NPDC058082 TaxID=3346331 RepID=UPI0036E93AB6
MTVLGLGIAWDSHQTTQEVRRLWDGETWARASDAEVRVRMQGLRHRSAVAEVRAVVDEPDGPRRVPLRHTDVDTDGLAHDMWLPVESGAYAGGFDVLLDPEDPGRVIAGVDAAYWVRYGQDDVRTSLWIAAVGLAWTAVWTPFAWRTTRGGSGGRHLVR